MELTLNSSSSLIKRKDTKSSRNHESSSNMSFAKMKPPTYQFQAKNSVKEMKFEKMTFTPEGERWEKLHVLSYPHSKNDLTSVPVFFMLPLDTVTMSGHLNKPRAMNASLMALKGAGVEGVMVDAWWGLVEKDGPMNYNWEGYSELIEMVQKHGLKLQVVMSFHQCGGNVGDSCR